MKEPLAIVCIMALCLLAITLVPAGTFSVSVTPKGSIREETPKAVVAPQVQQPTQDQVVG